MVTGQKDRSRAALFRGLSRGFSGFAISVGCVALVGWAFDIAALKSILPGWVSVKPNTALAFVLMGIAMLLPSLLPSTLNPQLSKLLSLLARLCGLLAGLIGLLTLSEYAFGWDLGLDQWLFREPAGAVGTSCPGRMAPDAALCFMLLAAGLEVARGSRKTARTLFASAILGWLVTNLALAQMLTYFTPSIGAYGWWGLTIMAVPTAAAFAVLGAAMVLNAWQDSVSRYGWGLSGRITAAFACGLTLLVPIGLNTSRSVTRMAETDRRIMHAEQVLHATTSVLAEVAKAQTHTRGYVITGEERYLKSQTAADAHCREDLAMLRQLTADNPQLQQQSARLATQINEALRWFPQVIEARRTGLADAARRNRVNHGEDLMNNLRATIEQIENEDRQLFQKHQQESESVSRFTHTVIVTGTVLSLIVFLSVLLGLNRAVTERNRAEGTLRASEERFRIAAETSNDVVYEWDLKQSVQWFGKIDEMLGYDPDEFPRTLDGWAASVHPEDLKRVMAAVQAHLEGGAVYDEEYRVRTKDGAYRWWEARGAAARMPDGKPVRWVGTVTDITDRKQAEEALSDSETRYR